MLGAVLGEGTYGCVCRATWRQMPVAVKTMCLGSFPNCVLFFPHHERQSVERSSLYSGVPRIRNIAPNSQMPMRTIQFVSLKKPFLNMPWGPLHVQPRKRKKDVAAICAEVDILSLRGPISTHCSAFGCSSERLGL